MAATVSAPTPPSPRRAGFAPVEPESFEITAANRVSCAPAHSAALPLREWPMTATFAGSMAGSVARESMARLAPHAPGLLVRPALAGNASPEGWNKLIILLRYVLLLSGAMSSALKDANA